MKLSLRETDLQIKESVKRRSKAVWGKALLFAAVAFTFAQGQALGEISPFSAAFLSVVPFEFCSAALLGGTIGGFFALPWQTALKCTCALFLITLFRLLIEKRFAACRRTLILPIVSAACVLSCDLVFLALTGFDWSALLYAACETAIAGLAACFFDRAMKTPARFAGLANTGSQDVAVLLVSLCTLLCCAAGLTVSHLAPARIVACFLVLFFADFKGAKGGCLAGVCVGAALSVDPATRFLLPVYALGGLLAGIFSVRGPLAVSLFFAATSALVAFIGGMEPQTLWCLFEILIAAVLFFLTPGKWLDAVREYLKQRNIAPNDNLNRFVSARLRQSAENIHAAADVVLSVSAKLDTVLTPEINVVFSKLQQNICLGCGFKSECWNTRYAETADDILTISGLKEGAAGATRLEKRCPRANAMASQVRQSYTDFVGHLAVKEKMRDLRNVVADQFSVLGSFLDELAAQTADSRIVDGARSRTLHAALLDNGIVVDRLLYFTYPNGRVSVEITMLEDAFSLDTKALRRLLSQATGRKFEPPEAAIMELRTTFTFEERAAYKVLFGQAQFACQEGNVCGDCVAVLSAPGGNRLALISDGMGTGARAAVDSRLTCALMEQLLRCGFSVPGALKMANCALTVKSTDESIATADCVCVNVYTGQADFYKAGAAISFLRRGNSVTILEEASLPIGILREVACVHTQTALESGDLLLLVSDGVTFGDCGWISDELLAWSTNSMDDLAAHIASLARLRSDDNTRDDITVVAVKLTNA